MTTPTRLSEIKKFHEEAVWKDDDEYIEKTMDHIQWLFARIERLESVIQISLDDMFLKSVAKVEINGMPYDLLQDLREALEYIARGPRPDDSDHIVARKALEGK